MYLSCIYNASLFAALLSSNLKKHNNSNQRSKTNNKWVNNLFSLAGRQFDYVAECVGVAAGELLLDIALIACCCAIDDGEAVDRGTPDSGCVQIG